MKRKLLIITALASLVLINPLLAQDNSNNGSRSGVFVKAGLNLANVSVTDNGTVDDAKMIASFHAGLQADLALASFLSLQPGVFFTGKGSKTQWGQPNDANYYRSTVNPYYVEVPVNLVFKLPVGESTKFFFGAGPYAAMGIAGKRKIEGKLLGVSFSRTDNIEFSNDDPTTDQEEDAGFGVLKRFDYGLNGTAGFEGKSILFSVNYGLGLAKLQSGATNGNDNDNKHRVLSATIGFRL